MHSPSPLKNKTVFAALQVAALTLLMIYAFTSINSDFEILHKNDYTRKTLQVPAARPRPSLTTKDIDTLLNPPAKYVGKRAQSEPSVFSYKLFTDRHNVSDFLRDLPTAGRSIVIHSGMDTSDDDNDLWTLARRGLTLVAFEPSSTRRHRAAKALRGLEVSTMELETSRWTSFGTPSLRVPRMATDGRSEAYFVAAKLGDRNRFGAARNEDDMEEARDSDGEVAGSVLLEELKAEFSGGPRQKARESTLALESGVSGIDADRVFMLQLGAGAPNFDVLEGAKGFLLGAKIPWLSVVLGFDEGGDDAEEDKMALTDREFTYKPFDGEESMLLQLQALHRMGYTCFHHRVIGPCAERTAAACGSLWIDEKQPNSVSFSQYSKDMASRYLDKDSAQKGKIELLCALDRSK